MKFYESFKLGPEVAIYSYNYTAQQSMVFFEVRRSTLEYPSRKHQGFPIIRDSESMTWSLYLSAIPGWPPESTQPQTQLSTIHCQVVKKTWVPVSGMNLVSGRKDSTIAVSDPPIFLCLSYFLFRYEWYRPCIT